MYEVSTESLFSTPVRNPNLGFMTDLPFHSFSSPNVKEESGQMARFEDMESGSMGSGHVDGGGTSCGEDERSPPSDQPQSKKKRYHRHTARQIQEMEALFKECPHPDDKQRLKLSNDLGLKPRQVKFWFQNRRTQLKAQQDRSDNVILRAENESLKNDNFRLQAAIHNIVCPNCGGPVMQGEMSFEEQQLRLENARLKDDLERLSTFTVRYGGNNRSVLQPPPLLLPSLDLDMNMYSRHFPDHHPLDIMPVPQVEETVMILEQEKGLALNLAITAADQLGRMCRAGEPLWVRRGDVEVLNLEEFDRLFPWPDEFKRNAGEFRLEATRDSAVVIMNSITLVDAFQDANKWMELFPTVVSKARTLQSITPSGHGNGSLQLMYAEFHVLTPLVPAREVYFLRYCMQNPEEGTWTVVDLPIDGFQIGHQLLPLCGCRRRPSGCIIQDMPNGYSQVMWVEHAEIEEKWPIHHIFQRFLNTGMAFGATRWLSVLNRQCERLASLLARNISDLGVIPSPEGRKNIMRLSQRMVRTFCANISSLGNEQWTALSGSLEDTVRVIDRKMNDPRNPDAVILTLVSTTWLPFSHQQVFDLLTDEHQRAKLDIISNGNPLHEVAHIANGSHPRNCVSLLRINPSSNQNVEILLQESSTHPTGGSMVIFSNIGVDSANMALTGEDASFVPLVPTGFVMFPSPPPLKVDPTADVATAATGCLLTVGYQVSVKAGPNGKIGVGTLSSVSNHVVNAVNQITAGLQIT